MRGSCVRGCRAALPYTEGLWCDACRREEQAKWDELAELHALSKGYARAFQHIPATDDEWRRRLDEVAPLAAETVMAN